MLITLYLAGLGASAMPGPQTSAQTCAIVEAGYRSFTGNADSPPPERVGFAIQPAEPMGNFVAQYRQYLGLTSAEFADMESNQHVTGKAKFLPRCDWLGTPAEHDGKRGGSVIAFNEPIVSTDGKLALVEVSSSEGISGWGELCVLRLTSESWTGRCVKLWSIR